MNWTRHPPAVVIGLLALSLFSLGPAIFQGRIPAQTDWIATCGPWGRPPWIADPDRVHNPGGGDDFFAYVPDRLAALREWRQGRLPLWNPWISGGVPFLGMQTANPLDPLIVLELVLPPALAMGLAYALLLFVAGLGVALYLRDQGVRSSAALLLAGTAFALNPYFTVWLENRVFLAGFATLPLCLWALDRVMARPRLPGPDLSVLVGGLGYAALAGTLQTLALFLLLLLVRLGWNLRRPRADAVSRSRSGFVAAVGLLGGLVLGSLPLIAGLEMLAQSTRLGSGGYYADSNFLHWRAAGLWFNPELFALPAESEFSVLGEFRRRFMSGSGWGCMGLVPLGLCLLALVRRAGPRRERVFWGGLAGLTLLFLFLQQTPLQRLVTAALPWLTDVDLLRGLIVVNLAGALLAGHGAAELASLPAGAAGRRSWLVSWGLFLGGGALVLGLTRIGVHPPHPLWRDLLPLVLFGGGAALAVWSLSGAGRRGAEAGPWVLALLSALELGRLHFQVNTFAPAESFYPRHPALTELARELDQPAHPRYLIRGQVRYLPPNTGSVFGLADVRGYSNIPLARFRLLLECAEERRDLRNLPILLRASSPIFALLGVRILAAGARVEHPAYELLMEPNIYRCRDSLPRAFLVHHVVPVAGEREMREALSSPWFEPAGVVCLESGRPMPEVGPIQAEETCNLASPDPTMVTVEVWASSPAVLVLADSFYPGWKAALDGREVPILPANWGLRGVAVSQGTHRVTFRYRPDWLLPATAGTGLALLLAVGGFLPLRRRS